MAFFNTLLPAAIAMAMVFLYGCIGEIVMEKAGHLNLGIPGTMCFGTLGGVIGVMIVMTHTSDPAFPNWFALIIMALLFSVLLSLVAAFIYAFLTVTLKCNQNVTGLALTTFGGGITDYFMSRLTGMTDAKALLASASKVIKAGFPFADNLGAFGKIFFGHGFFAYLAIIIAMAVALVMKHTRVGLNLRAVGENPATADAAGINVEAYKYGAILTGSAIAGLGGLFYVMDYVGGSWENSSTIQGFGWLAIALVIFSIWRSGIAIAGSILFGMLYILPYNITGIGFLGMKILLLVPYVVTVIVLILTSIFGKKNVQAPSSLGQSYFREER